MIERAPLRVMTHLVGGLLLAAVAVGLVRAQSREFTAKRAELRRQAVVEQRTAGLFGDPNRKKLYAAYPTPELKLAAVVALDAGSSKPLSLAGRFSDKTIFLSNRDALVLSDLVVGANSMKATVTVAPDTPGPQWMRVYAIAPVSDAESWVPVLVGTPQAYTMNAKNGWVIKLTPSKPTFTISGFDARAAYKAEYFRRGETAPFETMTGSLSLSANDGGAGDSYSFSMSSGSQGNDMAEMEALSKRMGELMQAGKFDGPEMASLQKKLEALQERLTKSVEAMVKDPAAVQRKQDAFGCGTIFLQRRGPSMTGSVSCGKEIGSLDLTAARQ